MRGHDEQTTHMFQLPVAGTARAGRPSAPRTFQALTDEALADNVAPIREPGRTPRPEASVDPTGAIAARFAVAGALASGGW